MMYNTLMPFPLWRVMEQGAEPSMQVDLLCGQPKADPSTPTSPHIILISPTALAPVSWSRARYTFQLLGRSPLALLHTLHTLHFCSIRCCVHFAPYLSLRRSPSCLRRAQHGPWLSPQLTFFPPPQSSLTSAQSISSWHSVQSGLSPPLDWLFWLVHASLTTLHLIPCRNFWVVLPALTPLDVHTGCSNALRHTKFSHSLSTSLPAVLDTPIRQRYEALSGAVPASFRARRFQPGPLMVGSSKPEGP